MLVEVVGAAEVVGVVGPAGRSGRGGGRVVVELVVAAYRGGRMVVLRLFKTGLGCQQR